MKVVIQRVSTASVTIQNEIRGAISKGLVVLAGFEDSDNEEDITWTSKKLVQLRIFDDEHGTMNMSVLDIGGEILIISQFTLHASTKKGNRPSYIRAAKPPVANALYEKFVATVVNDLQKPVTTGIFGADMKVQLINDGPVTIIIDSKNRE
jgi:D-aminoacyl-tRNA deacylase